MAAREASWSRRNALTPRGAAPYRLHTHRRAPAILISRPLKRSASVKSAGSRTMTLPDWPQQARDGWTLGLTVVLIAAALCYSAALAAALSGQPTAVEPT